MVKQSLTSAISHSIHPWLAGTAPIVLLAAINIEQIRLSLVAVPMLIMLVAVSIVVLVARLVIRNWQGATVWATLLVICFFAHGHILAWLPLPARTGHILLAAASVMLLVTAAVVLRLHARMAVRVSRVLSPMVILFFVLGAGQLVYGCWARAGNTGQMHIPEMSIQRAGELPIDRPDIYYIILDGYARADRMLQIYDFDNREFLGGLRERGFYIADESRSNYAMTYLSLASSLNMRYLDEEAAQLGVDSAERQGMYQLIQNNLVGRYLRSLGYRYVHVKTNWGGTETSDIADVSYPKTLPEFYETLIGMTVLDAILDRVQDRMTFEFAARKYKLIQAQLESIKQAAELEKPKFVFAHIICPHPPYYFTKDGEIIPPGGDNSWQNLDSYVGQTQFLNRQIEDVVDVIMKNSKRPPVIIIQADHGSATREFSASPANENTELIRERMPILNAFLVPDSCRAKLYPSITPVNSFRIILGDLFQDDQLPPLADRCLFSWYETPYRFRDVTRQPD